MRLTKKRVFLLAVVLLCVGYGIWWWAESGKVELEIGKDTTYITEPLNDDGTVNYVAYVNAQLSEGVTSENNAAIVLARAMGPSLFHEDVRDRMIELIRMDPLPEDGDYFVAPGDYVESLSDQDRAALVPEQAAAVRRYKELAAKTKGGGSLSLKERQEMARLSGIPRDLTEIVCDELDEAMAGPWSADKLPLLAGWLKANTGPLALIEAATKRRRFYLPMVSRTDPPWMVDCSIRYNMGELMDVSKVLVARAMLKSGSGDMGGAWEDLMTVRRLAGLISQGATLIEGIVGIAIDALGRSGFDTLIVSGKPSAAQLQACRGQLEALAPMEGFRQAIAFERFYFLDVIMTLYRAQEVGITGDLEGPSASWFDWNEALRTGNHWYDRMLGPWMLDDAAERRRRLKEAERNLQKALDEARSSPVWTGIQMLIPTRRRKVLTQTVTFTLLRMMTASLGMMVDTYDKALMESEMLHVAISLALHEAETGRFPATLGELTPKYLKALPGDRFSGKALLYTRGNISLTCNEYST